MQSARSSLTVSLPARYKGQTMRELMTRGSHAIVPLACFAVEALQSY